jgi:hypothetical protein
MFALGFIGLFFVLILDVLLFRAAGIYFPQQRKYLVPFLLASLLWPTLQGYWQLYVGDPPLRAAYHDGAYLSCQGLWYTLTTRQLLGGFIYRHWDGAIPWSGVLALVDVLLLGALLCLPVYLLVLIRRSWWFD